jgi:hypothetical protein
VKFSRAFNFCDFIANVEFHQRRFKNGQIRQLLVYTVNGIKQRWHYFMAGSQFLCMKSLVCNPLCEKNVLQWCNNGHIWNPIRPKFREDVEGAQIHIHTRLEHSRSNRNEIRQLRNFLKLWPLWVWPWKVCQIQNPGNMWCSLIRYTSHKKLVNWTTTVSS